MSKYKLTVSEQQAAIIANALDLFTRIGLGQFEEIIRVYDRKHVVPLKIREQVRSLLKAAKIEVGHTSNGSLEFTAQRSLTTFELRTTFFRSFVTG